MTGINRRGVIAAGVALSMAAPGISHAAADPEARTAHGPVRGVREDGINVFKGIRYGADTRQTRFAAPRVPAPWTEVMAATAFGAASPQRQSPQVGPGPGLSEDCLFLNVWTPGLRDNGRRPVLVYIHGGAYSQGSGSLTLYDGKHLAAKGDAVVVSLNHRLNLFGYLYLGPDAPFADSGNAGQLDLILALKWVRANIAEFGGDPSRVTVFGQSGGGAKIATMMAMPAAEGLFHRAWTMSGQQVTATGPGNARKRTKAFLARIGLTPERKAEVLNLPTERLLEGLEARDPVLDFGGVYVGPVLDDRNLMRHPFFPDAAPQSAAIPMVIGNTHDEARAFLGGDPHNFELTWEEVVAKLPAELRVDIGAEAVVAEYRRIYPAYTPSEVFFAAATASRSWRGAVEELNARGRQNGPTWGYQVNFPSPREGGRLRAYHTVDIPLVFGNVDQADNPAGSSPEAHKAADAMSSALLAFARTGNPNHRGAPAWPRYNLDTRPTMVFDAVSRLENDPRGAERRIFARVPYVQPGT